MIDDTRRLREEGRPDAGPDLVADDRPARLGRSSPIASEKFTK